MELFKTVENETAMKNGEERYTLSAICDDDGSYELTVTGQGGKQSAKEAAKRLSELLG